MPTGYEHGNARLGQVSVCKPVYRYMRGEVVDAVQRLVEGKCIGLGRCDPDEQRTGQARPSRDRDRVDLTQCHAGLLESSMDGGDHRLQVRTARNLWYDAAEACMFVHAGGKRVGKKFAAANDADAGLVARGLDPEHQRLDAHADWPLRITSASAPLGW